VKENDVPQDNNKRHLAELGRFGTNPGDLKGWLFLPSILPANAPLVVVLHGCTQTAAGYDHGSGWTQLAEQKSFAVLFAEQQRSNNQNLCFNWFEAGDIRRDGGEAGSIREMIDHVTQSHGLDSSRIFISGLSAGGAMANVMLATYPELFAGGAIIGGLPYGVSTGVGQAFERMHGRNPPSSETLAKTMRPVAGSRRVPAVSIWHGTHDQTVKPVNAEQIAEQWCAAHGLDQAPDRQEAINEHSRRVWTTPEGRIAVELVLVKGMAHGVPLAAPSAIPLGNPGPYMLASGISSTARIAHSWDLLDAEEMAAFEAPGSSGAPEEEHASGIEAIVAKALNYAARKSGVNAKPHLADGVGKVINDALRKAGLMR
jgi:poly(hydroxyalkanoate) depolymerase family esterase